VLLWLALKRASHQHFTSKSQTPPERVAKMKKLIVFVGMIFNMVIGSASHGDAVVNGSVLRLGGTAVGQPNDFSGGVVSTIDHIKFSVNTPGIVTFDILSWEDDLSPAGFDVNGDGEIAFFDSMIYLFFDDGSLDLTDFIDGNDDSVGLPTDGSISTFDSYLSAILLPGNYIVTVGGFYHDPTDAINGINPGNGLGFYPNTVDGAGGTLIHDHGDYRLTITGDVTLFAVPEPNTALLSALGLLAFIRIRKRAA
jgi:hypothetical protein